MATTHTRTITLTGRPPVAIVEADWPIIAEASDDRHDGQVCPQANRISEWRIKVRQHKDGRTLVYARYWHTSHFAGERCFSARRGDLLPASMATPTGICLTIERVAKLMANTDHYGDDAARWSSLAAECIADMPADPI